MDVWRGSEQLPSPKQEQTRMVSGEGEKLQPIEVTPILVDNLLSISDVFIMPDEGNEIYCIILD